GVVDFSMNTPPFAKESSSALATILNYGAAIVTTALAITLMKNTYHEDYLTVGNFAKWVVISSGLTALSWVTMSKAAAEHFQFAERIQKLLGRHKNTAASCTEDLSDLE